MLNEELTRSYRTAINEKIREFNKTKGRRKELAPEFLEGMPLPYQKYGRILTGLTGGEEGGVLVDAISKMAGAAVRTMLLRKPRPRKAVAHAWQRSGDSDYMFRLVLPRRARVN